MKDEQKRKLEIKDRRLWVSVEQTVQMRQYEPIKFSAGQSGNIPDDVDSKEYYKEIFDEVMEQLVSNLEKMTGTK